MTTFFDKRDRWGNRPSMWVLVAMAMLIPIAWQSVKQVDIHNDVENWLPSDDPESRILNWYRSYFPIEDRFLISWDGSSLSDPRVEAFAAELEGTVDPDGIRRTGIPYVQGVVTPQELIERMREQDVLPHEAIQRLDGVLLGSGPLNIRLAEHARDRSELVSTELKRAARKELGLEIQVLPRDEEPLVFELPDKLDSDIEHSPIPNTEHDFRVVWPQMHVMPDDLDAFRQLAAKMVVGTGSDPAIESTFFLPGSPVALSVELSEAGRADRSEAFREIRRAAEAVGIPEETLHMGGRPVAGQELNSAVVKAAWNRDYPLIQLHHRSVILFSFLVGIALSFFMLKSLKLALLVTGSAVFTMFVSVALVPVTGGSMNMVLVVMPTLLMVLTMSAAIHVVNYWKHAAHTNMATSIASAYRMARTPCTLAAVTTAIGLISLSTSPLAPVRDFGVYSAVGTLLALVVVLFGLTSMIDVLPARKPSPAEINSAPWIRLGKFLARYSTSIAVTCLLVFAVCSYGLKYFRTETKVIRYFPDDSRVVQDYNFLEENLAGIIPVDTVIRFDKAAQEELNFLERTEIVRNVQNRLQEHHDISGTLSLADFLPVRHKPDLEELSGPRRLLEMRKFNTRSKRTEEQVHESNSSARSFLVIAEEARDLEQQGDQKLNRAGDEIWKITAQVAIMSDLNYADLTNDLNELVQSELKLCPGATHRVTGMIPLFLRTQQAVLESLIRSFGLAFGIIAIVMMVLLRNPLAGLITMLPNLLPVGMVFGLISWGGLFVDIGTMITASVALGIAVDGTLHLLTWFKDGLERGLSRTESVSMALGHCGPAMWQTSAAVGIGLLMLFPADLLLISRFGWLMAALIGTALIADIIFLPALLAGPLGSIMQKSINARSSEQPAAPVAHGIESHAPHLQRMKPAQDSPLRLD